MRRDDTINMSAEALPAIVEAGLRSGHASEAAVALADLKRCAIASGTGWALGLLARSTALMAPPDQAGELYQEAIDTLSRTTATADRASAPCRAPSTGRRSPCFPPLRAGFPVCETGPSGVH